jgi:YYY domain-containing protein
MLIPILTYWLAAQVFGLIGLPIAQRLFGALPDRGYAFSKSLGLLLTGYLAWLIAMIGLAPFGLPLVVVCAGAVLAIGIRARRAAPAGIVAAPPQSGIAFAERRAALAAWLRANRGMLVGYEAIFALALVFIALLRSYQPDPWGTERPMDFAFFNAIARSPSFPPHDPWLAGHSINYYYFGYLLMAIMQLATGVAPAEAYNLSLALTFALAAIGIAGVIYNLIHLTPRPEAPAARGRTAAGRWGAIAAGALFVLCAGNLGGALQIVSGTPMVLALEWPDMARAVANGIGPRAELTLNPPFRGEYFDGTTTITPSDQAQDFNWWNPSRALWDNYDTAPGEPPFRRYAITEFPFFSFWLGDMHPHVMSLPFVLLALALGLQTAARPEPPAFAAGRRGWGELLLVGIILGGLYVINSWDLPTGVLLFGGALLIVYRRAAGPEGGIDWRALGLQLALALAAAIVLFLPFHLTFRSLVGGKAPLVDLPILATITRTLGVVYWDKSGLHSFLIIFGLFLAPLAPFVGRMAGGAPRALLWAVPAALALGLIAGFPLLVLLPLGALALERALAHAEQPAYAYALGAFALGCAICIGTEVVYIRDVFESRMNTIFKFYYQTWLIWGVLASYALWWLYARIYTRRRPEAYIVGTLLAAWAVGALAYPWHTAGRSFREGNAIGLAGQTPRDRVAGGPEAIAWLRANTRGDEVILEASGQGPGESYDPTGLGIGAVSAGSGLATVLGWPGHQQQWRAGDPDLLAQIEPRRNDVATIYTTLDAGEAQVLLDRYGVDYVYIGQAERSLYAPEALAKFEQLGELAFADGEVVIYRVRR